MIDNSRSAILARMKDTSITLGWGAVSVFSRARMNRALEQQYLSRLQDFTFLPPCSFDLKQAGKTISLEMVEFGTPQLSFETASLSDSRAMLRMNVIGGDLLERAEDGRLIGRHALSEGMGHTLEMVIELTEVRGIVDQRGRVILDLAKGARLSCSVLEGSAGEALAQRLTAWFAGLPRHRTQFDLGIIDYQGISPLTPRRFIIRTQAAPGATLLGADNYGAGAVVVFMQLWGNEAEGQLPGRDFPYLIPDDQNGERYSAALVVQAGLHEEATDERMDVLSSLLFPGGQVFREIDRATPKDLIVFGEVAPLASLLTLSPATSTVQAGERVQFTLLDVEGKPLPATRWTATSLRSRQAGGDGTFVQGSPGLYQAADDQAIGQDRLTVVITAEHEAAGVIRRASARVLVHHQAASFSPALHTTLGSQAPVSMRASRVGSADVVWRLLGKALGTLLPGAGEARFQPDPEPTGNGIALQQLAIDEGGTVRAGILLLNERLPVRIDSADQGALKPGLTRTFKDTDATWLPDAERRWQALGDGTLVDGIYTAPDKVLSGSDVVSLAFLQNGVRYPGGYSPVTLSSLEEEGSWSSIETFTVTLSGGSGGVHIGQAYANGYQQLQLDIVVKPTQPTDPAKSFRLSPTEVASIKLRNLTSREDIPPLSESAEGIEGNNQDAFATRTTPNRFNKAGATFAGAPAVGAAPGQGETHKTLFLHARDDSGVSYRFYVTLNKDGGGEFNSIDKAQENTTFEFKPRTKVAYTKDDYKHERVRVEGGSKGPGDPEDDDFDFHLRTQDYFKFSFAGALFETCEPYAITPTDSVAASTPPRTSMLTWESKRRAEVMASFTGWIFRDRLAKKEAGKVPADALKVDAELEKDSVEVPLSDFDTRVDSTAFAPGELVIVNFRHEQFPLNFSALQNFDKPVYFKLVDAFGNIHYLQFFYAPEGTLGRRNRIQFNVYRPLPENTGYTRVSPTGGMQ